MIKRVVVHSWPEVEKLLATGKAKLQCWPYSPNQPIRFTVLVTIEV